ncbi:MAG TPA: HAD hydrolase family protein [Gemmatimonadaceae bacterium]|nr:HAD hydrolase family protein [Gemmatimonadaceae bacterium]
MIEPALARRIRLVGLDVDGVMTDGGVYLGDSAGSRIELKRFHIQDGLGIRFLRSAGLRVVIVTGRVSDSVRLRAEELEVDDVIQDAAARKLPAFLELLRHHSISPDEAAFVGDDFPDLAVLRLVGLAAAVGNAVPEIRRVCSVQLERGGGHGAVREFAELLLRARGEWESTWERYVAERSGHAEVRR